ncbi:MAG TPA: transketolase C-terminal domain-containing protein [Acidimicrobiales bacterium]
MTELSTEEKMEDIFSEESVKRAAQARNIGAELSRLNDVRGDVAVLVADMGVVAGEFRQRHPTHFFDLGIAETNTMSVAAGLAAEGLIPFTMLMSCFGMLKCAEQIRTDVASNHLPVRIVARGTGLALGFFGTSHHTVEDIAIARSITNMTVVAPSDFNAFLSLVESTIDLPGPVYFRMSSGAEDASVYDSVPVIERGRFMTVRPGSDVTVIAIGNGVVAALGAAEVLAGEGVSVEVIDAAYLKPVDEQAILRAAEHTGRILTVEEHNVIGGLGTIVAEVLGRHRAPSLLKIFGLPDEDLAVSWPAVLIEHYGLTVTGVLEQLRQLLAEEK